MQNLNKFYIDGEWVKPSSTTEFPVMNPATEQQIGVITLGNEDDVLNTVDGGIPDLAREIAVIEHRFTAFNSIQNVSLVSIGEFQRSHANVVRSEVCESRSIVPDDVDAITLR